MKILFFTPKKDINAWEMDYIVNHVFTLPNLASPPQIAIQWMELPPEIARHFDENPDNE